MWPEICDLISRVYGKDYRGHAYKYEFFAHALRHFSHSGKVDFLEIGSFEGVSLVTVASILRNQTKLGRICSVDPYYPHGYLETPPSQATSHKMSTSETMRRTFDLYRAFGLKVEHLRLTSQQALLKLANSGAHFDLIFVDGIHEGLWPFIDAAYSLSLLRDGGLLCLDDIEWPDVRPVAEMLERHCDVVTKTATQIALAPAGSARDVIAPPAWMNSHTIASARIAEAEHELAELRKRSEEVEARVSLLEAETNAAAARAAELDQALVQTKAERDHLRHERDDVLGSTFWRITGPVRRIMSVLPPGLRRLGR